MTTTAVVATPNPLPAASRASSANDLRTPGDDTNSFDRQLDTARQQLGPHREQASSSDGRTSAAGQHQPGPPAHDPARKLTGKPASQSTTTPASDPADSAKAAAALAPARPLAGALDGTGDSAVGDTVKAAVDAVDGTAAASLAGAMLALLPSASAALQALTGGGSGGNAATNAKAGPIGSATAGGAGQGGAGLLPTGDAGASALTAADHAFVAGKADLSTLAAGVLPAADDGSKDASNTFLASALLAPPSTADHMATALLQVQAPVGSATFGQELGQQVAWLGGQAGQGVKQASIRLNPQELGPIDVKISMDKGRVDVVFSAQHPAAVTAVQQTLPQLDHMLAQHGLSLGHAEVGQQQGRTASQGGRSSGGQAGTSTDSDEAQVVASVSQIAVGTVSLLDAFA
jgi:flagellar hook-length control protein FliK